MNIGIILIIIISIVMLYFLIRYLYTQNTLLTYGINDATIKQTIPANKLKKSVISGTDASNFTYSIWFYINDWSYRYGKEKIIFGRSATNMNTNNGPSQPCPLVSFDPMENNLNIALAVYSNNNEFDATKSQTTINNCNIKNIPIQKWTNFLMSVYGRTLDVYLNGKLVRTFILDGFVKVNKNTPLYVTPMGGFSGYTTKLQYFPNSTNPQKAWDIYTEGFTNTWFNNPYKVMITLYNNNEVENSITI